MTYRVRKKGKKINIFDECFRIRQELNRIIPEVKPEGLLKILARCRRYYEGSLYYGRRVKKDQAKSKKKEELTTIERLVYDYLLRNKLNPSTTYRWFLVVRVPSDVKEKLEKGLISVKKALEINRNRKKAQESSTGLLILEEMREIIKCL